MKIPGMKTFVLNRLRDDTGVSGVGIVAWGVVFPNKKVALTWNTSPTSVAAYDSLEDCIDIHGHGGQTEFVF